MSLSFPIERTHLLREREERAPSATLQNGVGIKVSVKIRVRVHIPHRIIGTV